MGSMRGQRPKGAPNAMRPMRNFGSLGDPGLVASEALPHPLARGLQRLEAVATLGRVDPDALRRAVPECPKSQLGSVATITASQRILVMRAAYEEDSSIRSRGWCA